MDEISAWMDGQLDKRQSRRELARVRDSEELRERWDEFHVVGDALRGERMLSPRFQQRLNQRLAQEPTVVAPQYRMGTRLLRYGLSAAASLAAVALVGWVVLSVTAPGPSTELAKAPAVASPAPTAQLASVPSDGKMSEYLIAHQEFSPSTSIQGLAPYIRTVSSGQPAKGR
ncbi:MAG: hypothetical protein FJY54_04545 [Betaproteobacteria bacterium]|nr:hypothetical protein [Betaproteobacteria bacterium]